jgi:hypothetical protein
MMFQASVWTLELLTATLSEADVEFFRRIRSSRVLQTHVTMKRAASMPPCEQHGTASMVADQDIRKINRIFARGRRISRHMDARRGRIRRSEMIVAESVRGLVCKPHCHLPGFVPLTVLDLLTLDVRGLHCHTHDPQYESCDSPHATNQLTGSWTLEIGSSGLY